MDRGVDSAWVARGHRTQSADSNSGLGGGPTDGDTVTRDAAPPDSQKNSYGAELIVDLGGRDYGGTRAHTGQGYQTKKWSAVRILPNIPVEIYRWCKSQLL